MHLFAMFLAIATLVIALLLRFLLALNREIREQAGHAPQRLPNRHPPAACKPVNRLVLVHSNPLPLRKTKGALAASLVITRESSRV